MSSSPTTSWQIDGGKVKTMTDFTFLGSKVTVDSDCSHKIKNAQKQALPRCLLLGKKAMTNLYNILKSRDITIANKGPSSQSYGFSSSHVWM